MLQGVEDKFPSEEYFKLYATDHQRKENHVNDPHGEISQLWRLQQTYWEGGYDELC